MESCEYKQPVSLESLKGATGKTQGRTPTGSQDKINTLPAKSLSCSESIAVNKQTPPHPLNCGYKHFSC